MKRTSITLSSQKGMMALLMAMGLAGTFSLVTVVGYQTQQSLQQSSQQLAEAVDRDQLFNVAKTVLASREYCSAILGRNGNTDPNSGTNLYNLLSSGTKTGINFSDVTLQNTVNGFNSTNNALGMLFSRLNANNTMQNRKDLNKDYSINSFIIEPDTAWGVQQINGVNHRRARVYIDVRAPMNSISSGNNNSTNFGKVYGKAYDLNHLDAKEELFLVVSEASVSPVQKNSECWLQSGFSNDNKGDLYSQCVAQNNDGTNTSNSTYCAMTRKVAAIQKNYAVGRLDAVPDYKIYSNENLSTLSSDRNFSDAICDTEIELMRYNPRTKTNTTHVAAVQTQTVTNPAYTSYQACARSCNGSVNCRRRRCGRQVPPQTIQQDIRCQGGACPAAETSGIALREANTLWTMMCRKPQWNGCIYNGQYMVTGETVPAVRVWDGKTRHLKDTMNKIIERNLSLRGIRALNQVNKMASTSQISYGLNTKDEYQEMSDSFTEGHSLATNTLLGGVHGALSSLALGSIINVMTNKCDGAYLEVDLRCANSYMEVDRITAFAEKAHWKRYKFKCKFHTVGTLNTPTVADIINGTVNSNMLFQANPEYLETTPDDFALENESLKSSILATQNLGDLYTLLADDPNDPEVREPSSTTVIDPDVLSVFETREDQLWNALNSTISNLNNQLNSASSADAQALQTINSSIRTSLGSLTNLIRQFVDTVDSREFTSTSAYNDVMSIINVVNNMASSSNSNSTTRQLANEIITAAREMNMIQ